MCSDIFGWECVSCSRDGCLLCNSGSVRLGGVGTAPAGCAGTDGSVKFNATGCVARGECVVYYAGFWAKCVDTMVNDDGTCVGPEWCSTLGKGVRLRCSDGMFSAEGMFVGVSQTKISGSKRQVLCDVRVQRVVLLFMRPPNQHVPDKQHVPQQRYACGQVQRLCNRWWLSHLRQEPSSQEIERKIDCSVHSRF